MKPGTTPAPEPAATGSAAPEARENQDDLDPNEQELAPDDATEYDEEFDRLAEAREVERAGPGKASTGPGTDPADREGDPEGDDDDEEEGEGTDKSKAAAAKPAEPTMDELLARVPESERATIKKRFDELDRAARTSNEAVTQAEHRIKSALGRHGLKYVGGQILSATDAPKQPAGQKPAGEQQGKAGEGTAQPSSEAKERWKKFAEDYPEVAAAIEIKHQEAIAVARESGAKVPDHVVAFVEREASKREMDTKIEAISGVHRPFLRIVASPDFDAWVEKQTPRRQRLVNSLDPEEVIDALDLFRADNPALYEKLAKAEAGKTAAAPQRDQDRPGNGAGERERERNADTPRHEDESPQRAALRKRREAQSRAIEVGGTGRRPLPTQDVIDDDDDDSLFDFYAKKADERRVTERARR